MALSNWDTFARKFDGSFSDGSFTSPLGVTVETYKNWLHVKDAFAWQDGGTFIEPFVMSINEGIITYKDVNIVAWHGPQNGVYAVIYTADYKQDKEEDRYKGIITAGIYGGILPASVEDLKHKLNVKHKENFKTEDENYEYETYDLFVPDYIRSMDLTLDLTLVDDDED